MEQPLPAKAELRSTATPRSRYGLSRALVLAGGGMRAAFAAGVVKGLAALDLIGFDVALAVSASAPTLAYLAAGQVEDLERLWTDQASLDRVVRYAGLLRGASVNLFDTARIVDEVFRERIPLDARRLAGSPLECLFAAARLGAGTSLELCAFDQRTPDIWTALKASLALPGVAPAPIAVGAYRYVDAGVVDPVPFRWNGRPLARRTVVVLNEPRTKNTWLARIAPYLFRDLECANPALASVVSQYYARVRGSLARLRTAEAHGDVLVIEPRRPNPVPFVTRNPTRLRKALGVGYETACAMREVIAGFLFEDRVRPACAAS